MGCVMKCDGVTVLREKFRAFARSSTVIFRLAKSWLFLLVVLTFALAGLCTLLLVEMSEPVPSVEPTVISLTRAPLRQAREFSFVVVNRGVR